MRAGANAEREFVEAGVLLRSVTGFDATCKHRGSGEEGRLCMEEMVGKGLRSLVRRWAAAGMIKRTDDEERGSISTCISNRGYLIPCDNALSPPHYITSYTQVESMEVGYWTTYASSIGASATMDGTSELVPLI